MGVPPGDARPPAVPDPLDAGRRARRGRHARSRSATTPGHWEVGLLVRAAAEALRAARRPALRRRRVSDPCDGRTQGTDGMMDSLAYRNDAAIVLRRLIRSLPTRRGVLAVGTCDKGLPAMLLALAGVARPARRRRARRRHAAGRRQRGRRHGAVDRRALRARPRSTSSTPRRWAAGLRLGRRRLPVPGHGRDLAGRRRGARPGPPPRRPGAVRHARVARPGAALGASRCCAWTRRAPRSPTCSRTTRSPTRCSCTRPSAARRTCCCTSPRSPARPGCARPTVDDWTAASRADAAPRRRAAQRPAQPPDGARAPGRRRAGDAAAPARGSACSTLGARTVTGRSARRRPRLVGGERRARTPAASACAPAASTPTT